MYELGFTPQYVKSLHKRVQKGVKFLQKIKGPTWYRSITLATLKLESPSMCVLGQTFKNEAAPYSNGFSVGVRKLKNDPDGIAHGFNLGDADEQPYFDLPLQFRKNAVNPWTLLGELWLDEIAKAKKAVRG